MRIEAQCALAYPGGFELDASFATERQITAIFGPSGSGKTTLLNIIAGLKRAKRARIQIGEHMLTDTEAGIDLPPERREVGVVFQDQLLFPHLTIERNLRYGMKRGGERRIEFSRAVKILELEGLLGRYALNLSGGEKQRVALGRAILRGPRLLLLDEPLTALDDSLKLRILAYVERIVEEASIPALFVSHSQAEVRRLAQEVVVLERGRVVAQGTPEEALGARVALGLKDSAAPMNLLRIEDVRNEDGRWMGRVGQQRLQLPPLDSAPAGAAYARFAPGSVILSRGDVENLSVRNHLRGVVREIVELPEGCFVAVDVGQFLWAEVTPAAARDLALAPGVEVTCLIKTHSLSVG